MNSVDGRAAGILVISVALGVLACGRGEPPRARSTGGPEEIEVTAELMERGREVYRLNCVSCHGPEGRGDGPSAETLNPRPRDHSNRVYMDRLTDQQIADMVRMGGAMRGYPNMPSNPHIRGEDVAALVAFVRSLSRGADAVESVELDVR